MYIVIELQTGEGGVGTLVSVYGSRSASPNYTVTAYVFGTAT